MRLAEAFLAMLALLLSGAVFADNEADTARLNIVFILADDLGWSDTSTYGSTFYETPNLDRLAKEGMRFTNAYAASPVCSPTRASILTGKYPARLKLTEWIPGRFYPYEKLLPGKHILHLPLEEVTVSEALQATGYATGLIGKWHLGKEEEFHPSRQGFDLVIDGTSGPPPSYFSPYGNPQLLDGAKGEYLADRHTQEAMRFITENKTRPFFLYLAYNSVHTPIQGKDSYTRKYREKMRSDPSQKDPTYAAMVESLDDGIGRLMASLEQLGLADRTVVVFFSDNGGYTEYTHNAPLRGGKGSLYEGGTREPLIVRWPGMVAPSTSSDVPVSSVDFYPTMLEIAGVPKDTERAQPLDGTSLIPLLEGSKGSLGRAAIYWHYPHYYAGLGSVPQGAIRVGEYKLVEYYEDGRLELYNLAEDIGEQNNLTSLMPDKASELAQMLSAWREDVGAEMVRPNHRYDPIQPQSSSQSFYNIAQSESSRPNQKQPWWFRFWESVW